MSAILTQQIRQISCELIYIQGPIRILDAVKWSAATERAFLNSQGRELPAVSPEYYQQNNMNFRAGDKLAELKTLRHRVALEVGDADGLGVILNEIIDNYVQVVGMLEARGTRRFGELSCELWGSALTPILANGQSLFEYASGFHRILSSMDQRGFKPQFVKSLSAGEVVSQLRLRFDKYPFLSQIEVRESDGIVADAAAGGNCIKIRPDALFSAKDIDILEVHEGHTHVATSLNGRAQPYAQWLGYGPPRSTATQEGLAVLMEALTMSTYPQRVKKLSDRVRVVGMCEQGADAVEVFRFLLNENYSEKDAYTMMMRIFRGTDGRGGFPFAKDLSYLKGLIECYNFVYACLAENATDHIRFLFAGKLMLKDVPVLLFHATHGLIQSPQWLPPVFHTPDELASWFIFPAQLGELNDRVMQTTYRRQISKLRA